MSDPISQYTDSTGTTYGVYQDENGGTYSSVIGGSGTQVAGRGVGPQEVTPPNTQTNNSAPTSAVSRPDTPSGTQLPTAGFQLNPNDQGSVTTGADIAYQSSAPPYQPIVGNQGAQNQKSTYQQQATNPSLLPQEQQTAATNETNSFMELGSGNNSQSNYTVAPDVNAPVSQATAAQVNDPQVTSAAQYDSTQVNAAQGNIAQGSQYDSTDAIAGHAQAARGQVAQGSQYEAAQATAAQGQVDPQSLIQNQFHTIMNADLGADGIPEWARVAVTAARQQMNSGGLGNSTMAANATAAAILSTALPMAQSNANIVAAVNQQNTANIQQTNLANAAQLNAARAYNAGVVAQLNSQNLANVQQANTVNAQLQTTVSLANANADNVARQYDASVTAQLNLQNTLNQQQTLLSNQAATNAAKQFNAQSDQQNNQFFASLTSQIAAQNADRTTAISQFNSGQTNSMTQFTDNLKSQREEFNTQNQLLVDQSNVNWRRAINTANTASINAANQANAQNMFNLSQTAQNNLWQQARDEASFSLTSSENAQNRLLSLVNSSLNRQTSFSILASQLNANMFSQLGGLGVNLLNGQLGSSAINSIFGSSGGSSAGDGDFGGGGSLPDSVPNFT